MLFKYQQGPRSSPGVIPATANATWRLSPDAQVQKLMLELSKYSQTICFVTDISSKWEVPFFSLIRSILKKNYQFWPSVSRTSCPKTKHSYKVEVVCVNMSGMGSLQSSFGNYLFPHAIHCCYFHTKTHQQASKLYQAYNFFQLGPKCFDFILVESFDWPKVTFYRIFILHRIFLSHKCFSFAQESGKILPHMQRSGLSWSYMSSPELVIHHPFSSWG